MNTSCRSACCTHGKQFNLDFMPSSPLNPSTCLHHWRDWLFQGELCIGQLDVRPVEEEVLDHGHRIPLSGRTQICIRCG